MIITYAAIISADNELRNAGMATYTEVLSALAELQVQAGTSDYLADSAACKRAADVLRRAPEHAVQRKPVD